ncbi:MAG: hypothetical protein HYZ42_07595 [Bacteroidetes bacterium]|nr:hypothetical protein [Bacteroidota bacterium]
MNSKTSFFKTIFLLFGLFVGTFAGAQISNNTISSSQDICKGATPNLFSGSIPTGGSGTFDYQWQISTVSSTTDFNDISAANDSNYQSGALTTTTWFRRVFNDGVIGDTSNVIEITVNPYPTVGYSVNNASQCLASNNFGFTNSSSIVSGSSTYMWDFGDGNTLLMLQMYIHLLGNIL